MVHHLKMMFFPSYVLRVFHFMKILLATENFPIKIYDEEHYAQKNLLLIYTPNHKTYCGNLTNCNVAETI